jgi:hypothetical protein
LRDAAPQGTAADVRQVYRVWHVIENFFAEFK